MAYKIILGLRHPRKKRKICLFSVDALIVLSVLVASYYLRVTFVEGGGIALIGERVNWLLAAAVIIHLFCFYIFDLYNLDKKQSGLRVFSLIAVSVALAGGLIAFASYLFPGAKIGRILLSIHMPLLVAAIYTWRSIFGALFIKTIRIKNLLLIGANSDHPAILNFLRSDAAKDYHVVGSVTQFRESNPSPDQKSPAALLDIKNLVSEKDIRTIVVTERMKGLPEVKKDLIDLKFQGMEIYDFPTFHMNLTEKMPISLISDNWLLMYNQQGAFAPDVYLRIKRFFDFLLSAFGLIAGLPLFVVIAAAVKLTSKGPVFFRQERVGLNKKPYMMIKFRTMIDNAERDTGPRWSSANDSRITAIGKLLRKTHLDELPQLINILRGDMSFVGPRPIRECFEGQSAKKIAFYNLRHIVKPGVTGWAQVKDFDVRAETGPFERFQYDLFYIHHRSFLLDMFIILKTVQRVLFGRGV